MVFVAVVVVVEVMHSQALEIRMGPQVAMGEGAGLVLWREGGLATSGERRSQERGGVRGGKIGAAEGGGGGFVLEDGTEAVVAVARGGGIGDEGSHGQQERRKETHAVLC